MTLPPAARTVPPAAVIRPPSRMVIVAVADFPSDVAVITADPAATPVTVPSEETVALVVSELDQVIVLFSVCPSADFAVADRVAAAPGTMVAVSRDSVTEATGAGGAGIVPIIAKVPSLVIGAVTAALAESTDDPGTSCQAPLFRMYKASVLLVT